MAKFGKKNEIKIDPLAYNMVLIGESGIGKEQPISEPVLTENGWMPMGDITVGMKVYGEDGKLHNVVGVYPQGVKDVYEIEFKDGTKTRCGLEHLWKVHTAKQRANMREKGDDRFKILSVEDMLMDYKKFVVNPEYTQGGHFAYKYSIPVAKAIEFENNKELKLPPYALGLLLGDGCFKTNTITFTNSEDELFEQLQDCLKDFNVSLNCRDFENHKQATIISNNTEIKSNPITDIIKELGLYGCGSREKFIPKEYIYTSVENRLALLSGIINTDGGTSCHNTSLSISTYSKQLSEDIAELVRSLGFIATLKEYDRTNSDSTKKYDKEIEYKITIVSGDFSLLNLSEKHTNRLKDKQVEFVKSIHNIRLVGQEECQCIKVDNPSHLYITNDYIVTHNTTVIKEYCEKLAGEDGYLFLEIGKEDGHDAINGIVYETVEDWDKLTEVIDDIIENRTTDYKDLKVVVFDTYDELFAIAEPEVIRMHNRENPTKPTKSIKSAFGGFQAGEEKAIEIVLNMLWSLKKVGISFIVIGHVKTRNSTDPVTGEDYMQLTTNMSQKYFNAIKTKAHFLGVAAIDREIIKEKTGKKNVVTKKDIEKGVIKSQTRKITFRDDNFVIDSKSRFADIVENIPLDSNELIKALEDAIKKELSKSGKTYDNAKAEQEEKKAKEFKELEIKEQLNKSLDVVKDYFTSIKNDTNAVTKVMNKVKDLGYSNPTEIDNVDDMNSLLEFIEAIK